ncbi:hypothetical protein THAOC_32738 [Thalassiosira oceanica]|uniref:Uncharacterized protein n=1 Tax=Thalassiosira oceanica TaxID=159749 RepID=K0R8J3_THAOC|nr:hypothetical protein THAOC_32738 [Thalassiosira oceanica]|eukprot:EJK48459.1 hypothetical protein THAOC_32738 [Thalassiosira oceanica]
MSKINYYVMIKAALFEARLLQASRASLLALELACLPTRHGTDTELAEDGRGQGPRKGASKTTGHKGEGGEPTAARGRRKCQAPAILHPQRGNNYSPVPRGPELPVRLEPRPPLAAKPRAAALQHPQCLHRRVRGDTWVQHSVHPGRLPEAEGTVRGEGVGRVRGLPNNAPDAPRGFPREDLGEDVVDLRALRPVLPEPGELRLLHRFWKRSLHDTPELADEPGDMLSRQGLEFVVRVHRPGDVLAGDVRGDNIHPIVRVQSTGEELRYPGNLPIRGRVELHMDRLSHIRGLLMLLHAARWQC